MKHLEKAQGLVEYGIFAVILAILAALVAGQITWDQAINMIATLLGSGG